MHPGSKGMGAFLTHAKTTGFSAQAEHTDAPVVTDLEPGYRRILPLKIDEPLEMLRINRIFKNSSTLNMC